MIYENKKKQSLAENWLISDINDNITHKKTRNQSYIN